ncbi:MAG: fibronectin type III domain-containing protein [Oscillospiraceae bacterium]|nr:fibronectin type III domain-containing protein [Oscillospiraceae bacterium]
MYTLINHDCIRLKWDEVTGADGYYIYRTDTGTGETVKYKKLVTDTEFTVKGLEADTDYIFRVAAVSGGKVGKKSAKVSLTTPCEWYYKTQGYNSGKWKNIKATVVLRSHLNGEDEEIFDISSFISKFRSKIKYPYNNEYSLHLYQNNGYVCFEITHFRGSHDVTDYLWRMDNDGENLIYIGQSEYQNCSFINDKVYCVKNGDIYSLAGDEFGWQELSGYADNYDTLTDEYIKDMFDDLDSTIYFNLSDDKEENCFKEDKKVFSKPVTDGKYLYFTSEPLYNITDERDTIIYRTDLSGNNIEKIQKISYNKNIDYAYPNIGSILMFGCDGDYAYYYISVKLEKETYIFYRISLTEKNSSPEIIARTKYSPDKCEIINGYIYFTYYGGTDPSSWQYFCINIDNSETTTQDTPFEWYY